MSSQRFEVESEGFEALYRLYEVACRSTSQCRVVAGFLLGLYNSERFPFPLTELRGLDDDLFEDCMRVLRMDARVTSREVHTYFDDGGRKFEQLATDWRFASAQPPKVEPPLGRSGLFVDDNGYYNVSLKTYSTAPGYRDIGLVLDIEELRNHGDGRARSVTLRLEAMDAAVVMSQIADIHRMAWRNGRRPIDAADDEQCPDWLR